MPSTAPNTPCTITSWALDAALKSTVKVIDNRALAVPCYSPAGDNLHIASNEAFLLTDSSVRALYERKYRETASLYYAGQVPFQNILERLAQYLDRL